MTAEQVRNLPELERDGHGQLQNFYVIRGISQDEFVALWKDRPISLYVAKDLGLYAINIEMMPKSLRNTLNAADQELVDTEQFAPIRLAILRKYGLPLGLAITWDAKEISSLSVSGESIAVNMEAAALQWPYARNWLIWEGAETRIALGEQSVWYASHVGLAKRQGIKSTLAKEREQTRDHEFEQRAKRQQQLENAREAVSSRASAFTPFF